MQCHEGDVWLAATTRMHGMLCGAGYDGIDVDAVHCITWLGVLVSTEGAVLVYFPSFPMAPSQRGNTKFLYFLENLVEVNSGPVSLYNSLWLWSYHRLEKFVVSKLWFMTLLVSFRRFLYFTIFFGRLVRVVSSRTTLLREITGQSTL